MVEWFFDPEDVSVLHWTCCHHYNHDLTQQIVSYLCLKRAIKQKLSDQKHWVPLCCSQGIKLLSFVVPLKSHDTEPFLWHREIDV